MPKTNKTNETSEAPAPLVVVQWPIDELKPYGRNMRTHSPDQIRHLVTCINTFGFTQPVLIDPEGEIIAGHARLMAAEVVGMNTVPAIVLKGLTDAQRRAYRIADNRIPDLGEWDMARLMAEIDSLGREVHIPGFSETEMEELRGLAMELYEIAEEDIAEAAADASEYFLRPRDKTREVICPECGHEFQINV